MKLRILQSLLCLLLLGQPLFAAQPPLMLQFQNRVFDPLQNQTTTRAAKQGLQTATRYYILQFDGPVPVGMKKALTAQGVRFFDYIPQYAFLVRLTPELLPAVSAAEHVRWIGPYTAELKISSQVYRRDMVSDDGQVHVRIIAFSGEDAGGLREQIITAGGEIKSESVSQWGITFTVFLPLDAIKAVLQIDGIKWIEPVKSHKLSNNMANRIVQSRALRGDNSLNQLFGAGQIVAIADSGIDTGDAATLHADFSAPDGSSRLLFNDVLSGAAQQDIAGHGTHVAGIVLGNGKASGADPATHYYPLSSFAGAAPEALLYFQSVGSDDGSSSLPGLPDDLNLLFQSAYEYGARIHSNSWGDQSAGDYSSESVAVDQFTWLHKDFLPLFAAGNSGVDKDGDGAIDLYSLDTPATAKNCLSVGASESLQDAMPFSSDKWYWSIFGRYFSEPFFSDLVSDNPQGMAPFSARGPTFDGRYKPEIVAPGTAILSTRSSVMPGHGWADYNNDYIYMGGTSMATPLVAGSAALLREYLINTRNIASPSAALLKTALIHGALDLAPGQYGTGGVQKLTAAPNFAQGWGRLNLPGSVESDSNFVIDYYDISDDAPEDSSYRRSFTFNAQSGAPFKATLGWTDYPGSATAGGGLVNDLDLRVKTPGGDYLYPDNARHLGATTTVLYGNPITADSGALTYAMRVTAPDSAMALQSLVIAFSSVDNSQLSGGAIVLYRSDNGKPGAELYRHDYAYFPAGEVAFPVALAAGYKEFFIGIEKTADYSLYCADSNIEERAFIKQGDSWQAAQVSPVVGAIFRAAADKRDFDRINNTVSVTVPHADGEYTVEVSAHNIAEGPQPYALVLSALQSPIDMMPQVDATHSYGPAATLLNRSRDTLSIAQIESRYGIFIADMDESEEIVAYSLQLPQSQEPVAMRYPVSGLTAATADKLQLWSLFASGQYKAFSYPEVRIYKAGNWWLSRADGSFVAPQQQLDSAATYYVVSVVQDDGEFDGAADAGVISNTQLLLAADLIPVKRSSGNSGGCSVGTGSDYGTTILAALTFMMIAVRRYKRGKRLL